MASYFVPNVAGLNQLLRSPSGDVGRDIARRAKAVETAARSKAPTRTGALRGSIRSTTTQGSQGVTGQISASVRYAKYVEFGTSKMSARSFLRPALSAAK